MSFRVANCMKALVYLLAIAGATRCNRSTSQPVSSPEPSAATAKALEQYDRNGDRKLSAQELKASAALSASVARIDKNRDGSLSEDEMQNRFRAHQSLAGNLLFQV